MRIAIIGMGVAGVSVLSAMSKHADYQNDKIVLYDTPDTFGTGLPYQADSELFLLNQTADTMSLEYEDTLDFVKWIEKKKGIKECSKKHLPRVWYGDYVKEKLASALHELNTHAIKEMVTKLEIQENGSFLVQTNTQKDSFDLVHICTGHLPYQDPYGLIDHPRFIYHPYPAKENLLKIEKGSRVGVIGTSLTALDMMRFLKYEKTDIQLHFFSDTGRFSTLRGKEPKLGIEYLTLENLKEEQKANQGFITLDTLIEWFKKECLDQNIDWKSVLNRFGDGTKEQLEEQLVDGKELGQLQALIHQLDDVLPEFWLALSEKDKERFLKDYQFIFENIRSPIPRETIQELVDGWNKGELTVRGRMKEVVEQHQSFEVVFEEGESVSVDYLINATGQMKKVSQSDYQSELLNHLLNVRILQPEVFGGVQVLWPSSKVVSQRHGVIENLYVHGQLITGIQYGNNTAGMLMKHAHQIVTKIKEEKRTEDFPQLSFKK